MAVYDTYIYNYQIYSNRDDGAARVGVDAEEPQRQAREVAATAAGNERRTRGRRGQGRDGLRGAIGRAEHRPPVPCCRTTAKQSRGDEQGRAEAATGSAKGGRRL